MAIRHSGVGGFEVGKEAVLGARRFVVGVFLGKLLEVRPLANLFEQSGGLGSCIGLGENLLSIATRLGGRRVAEGDIDRVGLYLLVIGLVRLIVAILFIVHDYRVGLMRYFRLGLDEGCRIQDLFLYRTIFIELILLS